MKQEDVILRGESQIQKEKYHMFHLYVGPKDAEYIEAENRMCTWWGKSDSVAQSVQSCSHIG